MLFLSNRSSRVCSATTSLSYSSFTPQRGDFAGIGLPNDIAGQALLARLHEILDPFVIQPLGNTFSSAQLGDAVFPT
jgi:hypothetical protein